MNQWGEMLRVYLLLWWGYYQKTCITITYRNVSLDSLENCLNNEACAFESSMYEINLNETVETNYYESFYYYDNFMI